MERMRTVDPYPSLPDGVCVAELWRRLVAGLINLVVGVAVVAGAGFSMFKLRRWLGPPLRPVQRRVAAWGEGVHSSPGKLRLGPRMLLEVVGLTFELDLINRRSLGTRVMRIRRADARTGGPVSARSVLVRNLAQRATRPVLGRLTSRVMKRYAERMQALQPELKELQRAHRDDKAAQQEALMRFYREHNVNPLSSCLPTLVISVIAPWVPALLSPWRQNLPDRLAGIIWVVDNPPS
jgi:hypothetical protein